MNNASKQFLLHRHREKIAPAIIDKPPTSAEVFASFVTGFMKENDLMCMGLRPGGMALAWAYESKALNTQTNAIPPPH